MLKKETATSLFGASINIMAKKRGLILGGIILLIFVGIVGFRFLSNQRDEQSGKNKLSQAIAELRATDPQIDNPCLGTSVTREHSFAELSKQSIEEIKQEIQKDPGSC